MPLSTTPYTGMLHVCTTGCGGELYHSLVPKCGAEVHLMHGLHEPHGEVDSDHLAILRNEQAEPCMRAILHGPCSGLSGCQPLYHMRRYLGGLTGGLPGQFLGRAL